MHAKSEYTKHKQTIEKLKIAPRRNCKQSNMALWHDAETASYCT